LWLAQIAPFTHLLLSFGEEGVVFMISKALGTMTTALASEKDDQRTEQMWNPLSFLLNSVQARPGFEGATHHGVSCDGCKMSPIQGIRYKCTVCPNFDLCSKCEESKIHDSNHPLLKMTIGGGNRNFMTGLGGMHGFGMHGLGAHGCGGGWHSENAAGGRGGRGCPRREKKRK